MARTYEAGIGATTTTLLTKTAWESTHDVGPVRDDRRARIGEDLVRPNRKQGNTDRMGEIRSQLASTGTRKIDARNH